jgi:purine-binding chemotaxis protein CheW
MTSSYLVFHLTGRLFGMKLQGAIEILPWRPSRSVPLSFQFVEGLLDYRGTVYPVFNLAQRVGLNRPGPIGFTADEQGQPAAGRSIILVEENKKSFGITVDGVAKMVKLEDGPAVLGKAQGIDPGFVKGCVYDDGQEIIILDFERLFNAG